MVLVTVVQGYAGVLLNRTLIKIQVPWGILISIILILYIGLRPISGYYFGDTSNYALSYDRIQMGLTDSDGGTEWVFNGLMWWFANNDFSVHIFFLFCTSLYIGFYWLCTRRLFGQFYFVPLLVSMSMFIFFTNTVNAIRTGIAISALLGAMSYKKNLLVVIFLCAFSYFTHNSAILVIISGILAWFIKNPKYYILAWLLSIIASLTVGNAVANLFLALGIADDRLASYLDTADQYASSFSKTGFRWDFLLFSSMPIILGAYFIFKRNFKDPTYIWIYNIYVISNSFWVIVIRAAFSNRFAMLSWIIMPIVLIYPFYKKRFWANQSQMISHALILFYIYTFYTNVIYGGFKLF